MLSVKCYWVCVILTAAGAAREREGGREREGEREGGRREEIIMKGVKREVCEDKRKLDRWRKRR